ncbi:MAG: CotH kinase family protein [Paludibacteraceae bacterium]|nr:CotH kinase family protein [Paludibacteraceae bacterium]MBP5481509.1 CotH kinase family protein [Paludibacteraceae bacterium]
MLSTCFFSRADVIISEIMPGNISTYMNKESEFTGWVEFYNDGEEDVNIKGWTIINKVKNSKKNAGDEKEKWSWTIDFDVIVPAGKYKVVSFDDYQPLPHTSAKEKHAPYKVDPDGGSLCLKPAKNAQQKAEIDVAYKKSIPHLSFGAFGENYNNYGYMVPSAQKKNNEGYETLTQCAKPEFTGLQPQMFVEGSRPNKLITLSCKTSNAKIRYTLNGSIPTDDSPRYKPDTTQLSIDTIKIFRARAFKEGYLPSDILTGSFITYDKDRDNCEGENPPVVSIVTDKSYLSDSKIGIHCVGEEGIAGTKGCIGERANYNQAWKRAVNFEYFVNGEQKLSQEAMIGIIGGCSRKYDVKSLKISTSKRMGAEVFDYAFFNDSDKKGQKYSSLQLRNGGNGYESLRFRDGFIQSLAKSMGNIDYQAYQPVSYYLNGKYKGLMGLRERTNGSYIEANYGIEEDKIDLIEMTENKIEASLGDLNAYNEMIAFATDSNNYKKPTYVAELSNYMDVDEYINYMIFEQFIVNTDWPGNNQKCWRKHIGGKFRWILYDTDFGFGLYGWNDNNYCDASLNTIKWCTGEGEHNWANASSTGSGYELTEESKWKTILFKSLMKNKGFRNMFATKALQHLSTTFDKEVIKNKADSFKQLVRREHCATKQAGMPGWDSTTDGINGMCDFAYSRRTKYKEDLASYCKFNKDEMSTLKISCEGDFSQKVKGYYVNDVAMNGKSVKIKLFKGMDVNIKPILPNGYIVKEWKVDTIKYTTYNCGVTLKKDTVKVVLNIQEESYDKPAIVINEVCSKSTIFIDPESNAGEDWIELYNAGKTAVDVAGFYLKDKDTTVMIARGYEMTNIPPKGHLLLWADGRGKSGAQHLGFKLSTSGEKLTLFKDVRDSIILVDEIEFGTIGQDCSYGRVTDGAAKFKVFPACEEYETFQFSEASPGEANGMYNCENVIDMRTYPVKIDCDIANMRYKYNGSTKNNPVEERVLKGQSVTISPVLPKWFGFIAWELSTLVESTEEILNNQSNWKYYYKGSAPSGDWKGMEYDYTEDWEDGHGYMGYDEAGKERKFKQYDKKIDFVTGDSAKYITGYFRHEFDIDDTTGIKSFTADVTYDDGVAIYLNGKELGRYNLPNDSVLSYSDTTLNYYDDQIAQIEINPSKLRIGKNVIAAEVHQINSATSDMTFAMNAKAKYISHICKEETFTVTPKGEFTARLIVSGHTDTEETKGDDSTPEITLYPNPTENLVYLHGCKGKAFVTVSNQLGGMVIMQYVSGDDDPIDLQNMADGTYIFNITTSTQHSVGKIIKK